MYLYYKYTIRQRRGVVEIIISSNTSKQIYEQITSQIKAMIMSGELKTCLLYTSDPEYLPYLHQWQNQELRAASDDWCNAKANQADCKAGGA